MGKALTTKEYAARVGVHRSCVLRKISAGLLPAEKRGRDWFIDSDTEWVDMRTRQHSRRWKGSGKSHGEADPLAPTSEPAN